MLGGVPLGEGVAALRQCFDKLSIPAQGPWPGLKVGGGLPLLYNSAYFLQSIFGGLAFFSANFVF